MSEFIVNKTLTQQKLKFEELLDRLQDVARAIDNQKLQVTINNLRQNINEPFLFVVVGEVKAGKSSFINALLQADICRTAAEPCTDIIQQIVYTNEKFEQPINQHLQKVGLPLRILQNLSIVDTPGTNTIVEHHQEITKQFIPNSDLIL